MLSFTRVFFGEETLKKTRELSYVESESYVSHFSFEDETALLIVKLADVVHKEIMRPCTRKTSKGKSITHGGGIILKCDEQT
jgi:hypothetical protein